MGDILNKSLAELVVNVSEKHSFIHPEDLLMGELSQAQARYTNRKVACVIATHQGVYGGHNLELSPSYFLHAEQMALLKMQIYGDTSKVKAIYLTGAGQRKIKDISPCSDCFSALFSHIDDCTDLVLIDPNSPADSSIAINFSEVIFTYGCLKPSDVSQLSEHDARNYLQKHTRLSDNDAEIVMKLREIGLKENIAFLLTGSASGRGGINQLILERVGNKYKDLDFVAVTTQDNKYVVNIVESVLRELCPTITLPEVSQRGAIIRCCSPGEGGSPKAINIMGDFNGATTSFYDDKGVHRLEITSGKTLAAVMCRDDYRENNWFHKLS